MADEEKKRENDEEENEVALALVAVCKVGDKTYKAGETWTDESFEGCRMNICNPGGVVSYLSCPTFDEAQAGEKFVRIPGDNKYAYPHCCDYVFRVKNKDEPDEKKIEKEESEIEKNEKEGNENREEGGVEKKDEGENEEGKIEKKGDGNNDERKVENKDDDDNDDDDDEEETSDDESEN